MMWAGTIQCVLFALIISWFGADAAFAAMSVDLGSQFMKVGVVKPGVPMEIVLNHESRRKTPSVVSIRNGERLFGDAALAISTRYPQNVFSNLLDLVAKNNDHPSVQAYRHRFPLHALEASGSEHGVNLSFGDLSLNVEVVIAMLLSHARDCTEAYAEQPVRDVVITVPVYFSQAERLAVEAAAKMAKLNVLQLINDGTAVGLNYGAFHRKQITETPQNMLIVDMGAGKTTVTIVDYKMVKSKSASNPKMSVLGVGYDRTLGGLEATFRLRDLLLKKVNAAHKFNTGISASTKAMSKLFKEAERVKQVLSANTDHFAQIESFHEDYDLREKVTRHEFEKLLADFENRIKDAINQALKMAEKDVNQIDQVVLMGAGTRIPLIQKYIQSAVNGKELGRFINTDEAAAMGALFQAAHLSKGFKVKPFEVEDIVTLPVQVNFISRVKQENGEVSENAVTRELFTYKSAFPSKKKMLSFTSFHDDFFFEMVYGSAPHLNERQFEELNGIYPGLANISITGVTEAFKTKIIPEVTELKSVKVGFMIDASNIVRIGDSEMIIHRQRHGIVDSLTDTISGFFSKPLEEGEPVTYNDDKKEILEPDSSESTAQPDNEAQGNKTGNSNGDTKQKQSDSNSAKQTASADIGSTGGSVPETQSFNLQHKENYIGTFVPTSDIILSGRKTLETFDKSEKLAAERGAALNELESLAFECSLLVDDTEFVRFSKEEERVKLNSESSRIRLWLEDEISQETPLVEFRSNVHLLKDIIAPVKKRISEAGTRPKSLAALEEMLSTSLSLVKMGEGKENSLFAKNDTETFGKKLDRLSGWLKERKAAQESKSDNEDPAVLTRELEGKIKALDRELKNLMKKMKVERTVNVAKEDLAETLDDISKGKDEAPNTQGDTKNADEADKAADADDVSAQDEPTDSSTDRKTEL